jgi:MFS transporter, OFA family, oxalate/formate antiporter
LNVPVSAWRCDRKLLEGNLLKQGSFKGLSAAWTLHSGECFSKEHATGVFRQKEAVPNQEEMYHMSQEQSPTMNRWLVVVGAVVIQFCLGAIYAWSVFTPMLTKAVAEGGYGFSAMQASNIFSAGLVTFAIVMVVAGRMLPKVGPRPLAMAGSVVLGIGYILGGFVGTTYAMQLLCIGVIGGAGIGLAYVVPIAVGIKWFPDKRGMLTGLAVAGFGFGATLWVKLAGSWFGGLLNTTSLFGLPGVQSVFVIYGITFLVVGLIGSVVMVDPPKGYLPAGWTPPDPNASAKPTGSVNFDSGEMLKTPQFYVFFATFACSALSGLMVIYCIKLFGIDALQASGAVADAAAASAVAGTAMAWYAIFNGLGRIVWGSLSDKTGRRMALIMMCTIQGIMMLAFFKLGASTMGLIVCASIIGFNFGGNFALFPAATAVYFGNKNVGKNYGWVFLAYGVAGFSGPKIAAYFKDAAAQTAEATGAVSADAWLTPFVIAGIACLVAAALSFTIKAPKPRAAE